MNLNPLVFVQNQGLALIFKVGFLVILGMIELFLVVVLKQIRSMNTIVTQPDMFPYLQTFVFLLMFAVIALFLASLAIL